MAKEITYYGELRPTGVDSSMTRRLTALAGLADQVQDTAYQYAAGRAQEIGAAEGLAAGQQAAQAGEDPKRRKGFLSTLSIKDQAYNKAMEDSFMASTQVDIQNDISRIAAENPNDSLAFVAQAQASSSVEYALIVPSGSTPIKVPVALCLP